MESHPFVAENGLIISKKLLLDLTKQLFLNATCKGKRMTSEGIASYLKEYFDGDFKTEAPELHTICYLSKFGRDTSSIERALRLNGRVGNIKYEQLEFYCYACWKKSLADCVLDEKYLEGETKYLVRYTEHFGNPLLLKNTVEITPKTKLKSGPALVKDIKWITSDFWSTYTISDSEKRNLYNDYFTHIDSGLALYAVANNDIVTPNEILVVNDYDGNIDERPISAILDIAASQSFSLVKILAEGGVGKSTFLYWIAKEFYTLYNIFLIKKIEKSIAIKLIALINSIEDPKQLPSLFLIDDIAYFENITSITDFIEELKDGIAVSKNCIFLVADRETRYNSQFERKQIERVFNGNIQLIQYRAPDKVQIFEKVYKCLASDNPQLDNSVLEEELKRRFLNFKFESISESIFQLLLDLKIHHGINYEFDWIEWRNLTINSKYSDLEYLFVAVACFYQFGIKLPITYKSPLLGNVNRLMIIDAITSFGLTKSPIRLSENREFLELKNEYVTSWFLNEPKYQLLTQGFFKEFLSHVDNPVSAKLFRKIRKILLFREFKNSCIGNDLSINTALEIVNRYLKLITTSNEERERMLNEKGLLLVQLNREEEAVIVFKEIINANEKNNIPRDQLAKIYSKSPETYHLALKEYIEILKNKGEYAFIEIRKLLSKSSSEGVSLEYDENIDIEIVHKIIEECIHSGEFKIAENLLSKISIPNNTTAKCCNLLAHALTFTEKNIPIKKSLYETSIKIYKSETFDDMYTALLLEYAVFLFRIRKFSGLTFLRMKTKLLSKEEKKTIELLYNKRVRQVSKLFFDNMPTRDNLQEFEKFFYRQCTEAAALLNFRETNVNNILQGVLILNTVRFHSKHVSPDVFYHATKSIGYAYANHAVKMWNNLSVRDNMIIAESCYDQLMRARINMSEGDCIVMLKNLQDFNDKKRALKIIRYVQILGKKMKFERLSLFIRFNGNARKMSGDYEGAMKDYEIACNCLDNPARRTHRHYFKDRVAILNNMGNLICQTIEELVPLKNYTIQDALKFCTEIARLMPDFKYLTALERRILKLLADGNNEGIA